jgi:hypothetical protein
MIEARPTKQPFSPQASGAAGVLEGGSSGKICRPSALESYRRLHARYGVSVVGWTDSWSGRNGHGEVAGRVHMSWRVRVRPAPFGIGEGWHLIEQQAYADVAGSIEALDVLCSGFRAEPMNV